MNAQALSTSIKTRILDALQQASAEEENAARQKDRPPRFNFFPTTDGQALDTPLDAVCGAIAQAVAEAVVDHLKSTAIVHIPSGVPVLVSATTMAGTTTADALGTLE